jgi:hypothetical protein
MKNKIIYGLIFCAIIFTTAGCKKYLDVNKDPNNPTEVPENLLLPPIIMDIGVTVAGGSFSNSNTSGVALINAYWMQQLSLNQPLPQYESYKFSTGDAEYTWGEMYINILQNLKRLRDNAAANENHSYGVIGKVLTAYTLGITTDMWGDIPYTQAFEGSKPVYDKQEDIYKLIQSMLDEAIAENKLDPGNLKPGADDFLYGGNMANWEKFAYALKARHYIHLTKAPGHTALAQADLALAALQKGFTGTGDEATLDIFSEDAGQQSPWFKNTELGTGGVVLGATLVNFLVANSDPRLPIIANKGSQNSYLGRVSTSDVVPDVTIYSTLGDYFGGANPDGTTAGAAAPIALLPYSELEFIKAEATFIKSGAAAAQPIYQQAIKNNMSKLGLDINSAPVTNYIAARGTLTNANALQRIMEEKSIANLLSVENYNDWRRTGFPVLAIVANPEAGITTIPRKYQYSQQEISTNPQPENTKAKITDRVWWDTP